MGESLDFTNLNTIDVFKLEKAITPKLNLSDTYERYTGKPLEDSHDAEVDVIATIEVLKGQLKKLGKTLNIEEIQEISNEGKKIITLDGSFESKEGSDDIYFTFGKHKGKGLKEIYKTDRGYIDWYLKQPIAPQTRQLINSYI